MSTKVRGEVLGIIGECITLGDSESPPIASDSFLPVTSSSQEILSALMWRQLGKSGPIEVLDAFENCIDVVCNRIKSFST